MREASSQPQIVPLNTLPSGTSATVEHHQMCREDCELLSAMGLTENCKLRICRVGEPCIIQVAATRLGLSSAMAKNIMVTPDDSLA